MATSSSASPGKSSCVTAVNTASLQALHSRIAAGDFGDVHSVIVAQSGRNVAEWYFTGEDQHRGTPAGHVAFDADTLHDLRSVTKSVVSLLIGVAVGEGRIKSLDEPVLSFFPEYRDLHTPQRMKIRLRDLLSMTAGLAWDEDTFPYTDPRNSETAMDEAPDRIRYALEQKIISSPGATFRYSGGNVALIGEILRRTTGRSLDAYAEEKLFRPLGITQYQWYRDRLGTPIAASGLRLRPIDMAKIGQLMLDHGRFNGRQVVPATWITAMSTPRVALGPGPCATRYGYFTWISPGCPVDDPPVPWYGAIGNGGQRIWVVPSRVLVVVLTEGLYDTRESRSSATAILSAVLGCTPTIASGTP